ncbi:BQ5605_C012g06914 [Microbotryum silenes-dioicae]|uniref:BQ5605_C012g06914 protein n=1 Tax=Microbotryum silenes-dioicae TaxID=796604 RepID=A0A2X0LWH0_9BASI|nr:BQ5605_C012g06914 [Microbotryum silenes-dioicae]
MFELQRARDLAMYDLDQYQEDKSLVFNGSDFVWYDEALMHRLPIATPAVNTSLSSLTMAGGPPAPAAGSAIRGFVSPPAHDYTIASWNFDELPTSFDTASNGSSTATTPPEFASGHDTSASASASVSSSPSTSLDAAQTRLNKRTRTAYKVDDSPEGRRTKQKRKGRVITQLREMTEAAKVPRKTSTEVQKAVVGALNLAPTCSSSKITETKLADSLGWHLINLSNQELGSFSAHKPLRDVRRAWQYLWYNMSSTNPKQAKLNEVIYYALAALGARRSTHSAIVGFDGARATQDATPSELVKLQLGVRREQACRRLVDIAIEKLVSSGLLEEESIESHDAMTMTKIMLFGMCPEHVFTAKVIDNLKQRTVNLYRSNPHAALKHNRGHELLIFDTFHSAARGTPPTVQDDELHIFGWQRLEDPAQGVLRYAPMALDDTSNAEIGKEPQARSIFEPSDAVPGVCECDAVQSRMIRVSQTAAFQMTLVAISIFRELNDLRRRDPRPLQEILPTFERLFIDLDKRMHDTIASICSSLLLPHLLMVPHLTLAALLTEANRRCQSQAASNEYVTGFLVRAQCRFLGWLRLFVKYISSMPLDPILMHTRALMLIKLDCLEGWVEIAFNGAKEHELGCGPLSNAGFSLQDLRSLHETVKEATKIFAVATEREAEFTRGFEMMGLTDGQNISFNPPDKPVQVPRLEAEDLVAEALRAIMQGV